MSTEMPRDEGDAELTRRRDRLVEELAAEGIRDEPVLSALRRVPRHRFVPADQLDLAYGNFPLPIGGAQTISQPFIVAFMTEAAALEPTANVLEIGTGSGYQLAVLAEVLGLGPSADLAAPHGRLCSVEIRPDLARRAEEVLRAIGYRDVAIRVGDGYRGWPERAPFDAILVTAAPPDVPAALKEQLAVGGRLVIPVGVHDQSLLVVQRTEHGFHEIATLPVRFVPLVRGPTR